MNTEKTNNKNITEKAKDLIDKTSQTSKIISNTAHAVTESANAVTRISEAMEDQENRFMDKYQANAKELRHQLLDEIINDDKISIDDKLKYIKDYQEADTEETVKLLKAHSSSNEAQGNKALKIGAGVGFGALGLGGLALALKSLLSGKNESA